RGQTSFSRVLDPSQLNRFEDLFAGPVGVVIEAVELHDPTMQIGETDLLRIDFRVFVGEGHCDLLHVYPLHGCSLLSMVYFRVVDRVAWDLDDEILILRHARLAREPRG